MTIDGPALIEACATPYPDAGTLRLHPHPEALARPEPDRPGRNRFDDPEGRVAVRYTATRLIGCLRETLARFRPSAEAEALLASIGGIDPTDVDYERDDADGVADWLAAQRVGTVRVLDVGSFIDVEHEAALLALDKHPDVRNAVEQLDRSGRLDVAYLRLGGRIGRPVSQAVGVAVREWLPQALGIGYRSRLATDEPCWAIWQHVSVDVTTTRLDPENAQHRGAVRMVAASYEIPLPETW